MARSPSGEHRPSTSGHETAPLLLWLGTTGHRIASLTLVLGESWQRKKKMFLVFGEPVDAPVLLFRGSITVIDLRWTASIDLDQIQPKWV
jgi:hypothetical protein